MRVLLSILFILGCFSAAQAQCTADNCKLPDCRCANSSSIPGDLEAKVTPQIVLVTFENALTKELSDLYKRLFASRNPNGCSTRGTFYVQDAFTDYDVVSQLFDTGHEMGVFSVNGTVPVGSTEWMNNIRTVVKRLQDKAGIASDKVHGVRAPELNEGGSDEFIGLSDAKLSYDASCAISRTDQASTALWPYTYDFVPGLKCDIGESPDLPFKGKWQFLITDLKFGNQTCATPAACTGVKTKKDAFDMFYDTFKKHYNGKRAPIVLAINPQFVETDFKLDGTVQFLEYIRAAYDDTWVVTANQALEWIKDPTPTSNLTDFTPWKC